MKILFITPSYKPAFVYGGPIVVISLLAEHLAKQGHQVTVYTTTANGAEELPVTPNAKEVINGVDVYYFKRNTGDHTHVSFALWRNLNTNARLFDAIHIHSWWSILVVGAAWICKRQRIVPVLSPHGMFSDYILNTNNALSKKWIHKLIGKRLLSHTFLHVSTQMEWEESRKIIPDWKGAIIPNPVLLPQKEYLKEPNPQFTIGFLSRIDPKKGLDILIQALSQVSFSYKLIVAGSGDPNYIDMLKILSRECGNHHQIEWVGWKGGEEKFLFLSQLDLFSLTSHSENFAIVVIESLSVGTPVLISNQVGLYSYVQHHQLGWVTENTVEAARAQLEHTYYSVTERQKIQLTSPQVIRQDFDMSGLTQQYVNFYTRMLDTK